MKSLLAAAALCAVVSAHAGPRMDLGPYILTEVGHSHQSAMPSASDEATSMGVTLGVQLDRHFAVETSMQSLGKRALGDGGTKARWEAVSVSAVGRMPLMQGLDAVGKLGVARTSVSERMAGVDAGIAHTGFVVGAGVDYSLNRNWTVRTMLDVMPDFAGSGHAVQNVSVGLKYRF